VTISGLFGRALLGMMALAGAHALPERGHAAEATGKTIVLVVQQAAAPDAVASDALAAEHLRALGYTVRVIDQAAPAQASAGAHAILISGTISSNKLQGKYRASPIPVIAWEPYILPHLGMVGKKENADFGTKERERWLWVVNTPHPASGGLQPFQVNVQKKNTPMGWAKPGLGTSVLASFPGEPERAAAFVYEKGAVMDYENIAPARRGFIFIDTAAFGIMNEDGLKMFDAMVAWAAAGSRP
jgi:hypothetical protein